MAGNLLISRRWLSLAAVGQQVLSALRIRVSAVQFRPWTPLAILHLVLECLEATASAGWPRPTRLAGPELSVVERRLPTPFSLRLSPCIVPAIPVDQLPDGEARRQTLTAAVPVVPQR